MRWWFALTVLCLIGAGCRAPTPTIDPFAPYGARVIPPPATGAIGAPNGYYQPAPAGIPANGPMGPSQIGPTSMNPLQDVPPVANQPAAPRTSSVPNPGNWESASYGWGQSYGAYPYGQTMPVSATAPSATTPSPVYVPSVAPASHNAPFNYAAPPVSVVDYQQNPLAPTTVQQPLPIRPSGGEVVVSGPDYGPGCCTGDTVYIPQSGSYVAANTTGYMTGPSYATGPSYGMASAHTTGWRRRR